MHFGTRPNEKIFRFLQSPYGARYSLGTYFRVEYFKWVKLDLRVDDSTPIVKKIIGATTMMC